MKNTNKKGFTIVELVVVIAVIAILAAVLIPTVSGLVKKANETKDVEVVKYLNTALAAYVNEAVKGNEADVYAAVEAAKEFGYDLPKLNAKAEGNEILWDDVNKTFCYLQNDKVNYVPEVTNPKSVQDSDFWVIDDKINTKYSTYYYGGNKIESTTSTGIAVVTDGGDLEINAPNADVFHYGKADNVVITAVASSSYNLYGEVATLKVTKGNVAPQAGAKIQVLAVLSNDAKVTAPATTAKIGYVVISDAVTNTTLVESVKTAVANSGANVKDGVADVDDAITTLSSFAGGEGTADAPYLIANAEQLANISTNFEAGHKYYKVADGVTEINCTGLTRINLNGSFDGNGVVLSNLTDSLFNSVTADSVATVKNINIRSCYIISNSYYDGIVVRRPQSIDKIIIDNVNVTGYAESVIMSTYVGYTETVGEIEISNCTSSASLVSTGSQVSGFVGNLGTSWGKVTVTDSIFNGAVVSTASANYLIAADCNAHLTLKYTDAFAAANSNLHAAYENQNADALACDKYTAKFTKMSTKTLATPNVGEALTVTKDANAVTAKASFVVGVNPGNYTRVCQSEEIDLTDVSGTFTTDVVKLYNVVINDGVHGNELVGDTQYISDSFSDGTYNCIVLTVVQYDAVGNITSISTCTIK